MSKVSIQFFGMLTELIGENNIVMENVNNTDELMEKLIVVYPKLANQSYILAINNTIVKSNMDIMNDCNVACMPPFSGG